MSIAVGCVFSFLAVAAGAFGAHGLKNILDAYSLDVWQTATLYMMFHAVALIVLGLFEAVKNTNLFCVRLGFSLGIVLFSGSLYALALTQIKVLGAITPIGGVLFLLSWALFAKAAYSQKSKN